MTSVHLVIGVSIVVVNTAAAAVGAYAFWRMTPVKPFWPLLRLGQALIVIQAGLGAFLLSSGREPAELHLIYGLVPLGVAFIAEQLRVASAQQVLDRHELADAKAVGGLPEAEQRLLVLEIVRREIGVMAASAAVIALLALRAGGWW
jgi:hypothetical protein